MRTVANPVESGRLKTCRLWSRLFEAALTISPSTNAFWPQAWLGLCPRIQERRPASLACGSVTRAEHLRLEPGVQNGTDKERLLNRRSNWICCPEVSVLHRSCRSSVQGLDVTRLRCTCMANGSSLACGAQQAGCRHHQLIEQLLSVSPARWPPFSCAQGRFRSAVPARDGLH